MTLLIIIAAIVLLLMLRVPVAFALLIPSLGYFYLQNGTQALQSIVPYALTGINSFPLLAVPLFILMGNLANATRVTEKLFSMAAAWIGHVRGSLGYVNVLVSFGFSWMSGAALADSAGLGKIEVPEMKRRGYDETFAVGITGASAIIGPIMPPSIPAVLYAVAGGVSLGGLLIAGVIPAFLLVIALCISVYIYARNKPELREPKTSLRFRLRTSLTAVPSLMAPVILIGGILAGVFTPTEAAAVAASYLLLLGFVQRTLSVRSLYRVMLESAFTTASVLFIVSVAAVFGRVVAFERGPQMLADAMTSVSENPLIFLLMINIMVLIVGMILEPASAILILVPVLLPVAAQYGISPLHFGSIVILNLMIGLITPPIGMILYVLSSVTDIPVSRVLRGTSPFLPALIVVLLLITYFPIFTTYLPSRLLGIG
jgi:tripartite ATP-independent transporter DctM subunit